MELLKCTRAFADGGVIGANPSTLGGTWACVFVNHKDEAIAQAAGTVTPSQIGLPTVTNNYTELLACVELMERLPAGWDGHIYTDSNVTRLRLVASRPSLNGIPDDLAERLKVAKAKLGAIKVVLLDGHPSKQHLADGRGKRGHLVSKWNVVCDELCRQQAFQFRSLANGHAGEKSGT